MTTNTYVLGDLVVIEASFVDENGLPADPAVIKLELIEPAAAAVTYTYGTDPEVIKTSTGRYQFEVDAQTAGIWNYYWFAPPGDGQAAQNGSFLVIAKNVANFSFDPALADDVSLVRFHIADTDETGYFLADQTIRYYTSTYGVSVAIVRCLQYIVAQLSQPTFKLDWLHVDTKTG